MAAMLRSYCSAEIQSASFPKQRLYLCKKVKGDDLDVKEVQMQYFDFK